MATDNAQEWSQAVEQELDRMVEAAGGWQCQLNNMFPSY
jgi:hypothetical protein